VLQARLRRVTTCPAALFGQACGQFYSWMSNHPILGGIAAQLRRDESETENAAWAMLAGAASNGSPYDPGRADLSSLETHAATCLGLVRGFSEFMGTDKKVQDWLLLCTHEYLTGEGRVDKDDRLETARDVAVEGLYEFLDEQLDTRNMASGLLAKYKQRSEWFRRQRLRQVVEGHEGRDGERALAIDLQEYLFDQGAEFVIEASTASGQADLVLRDSVGEHLVLDAKYVKPGAKRSKIKRTYAEGFHQVVRYCDDYDEPFGFLVVFLNHEARIQLPLATTDGLRYLPIGGKIVYCVEIRIGDSPSASKAGTAEEIILEESELVNRPEPARDGGVPDNDSLSPDPEVETDIPSQAT